MCGRMGVQDTNHVSEDGHTGYQSCVGGWAHRIPIMCGRMGTQDTWNETKSLPLYCKQSAKSKIGMVILIETNLLNTFIDILRRLLRN
jgi:hypothetical protein